MRPLIVKLIVKWNTEVEVLQMTSQTYFKFPPGKLEDTIKLRVPSIGCGSCNGWYMLEVIIEKDLITTLYRSSTEINSQHAHKKSLLSNISSTGISIRQSAGTVI